MNSQCKLCAKGVGTEPGLSQREIAKKYDVARSSVQRHLKHTSKDASGDSGGKLTVMASGAGRRSTLEVKGNEGSAELSVNEDLDEFFKKRGIDPDTVEVTGRKFSEWDVQTAGGTKTLQSQKVNFKVIQRAEKVDLPSLFQAIEQSREDRKFMIQPPRDTTKDGLVVVWADPQTGKVDRNGGTRELTERVLEKRDKLYSYIQNNPAKSATFLNLGDSVENIENTSSQIATNDLSLMEQVEVETVFEHKIIDVLAATHDNVKVAVVPSNHCQLRRGKGLIGTPGDDWGIHIVRMLQFAYSLNNDMYGHVDFTYPDDKWIESLVIDVEGVKIGIAHGHQQNKPDSIPVWWAKQVHGAILHDAEILVTGHFHHYLRRNTGVHINTGRPKYHIQAPALDNGSSWYQNTSGESAEAGLLIFRVNEDGYVFGSEELL